MLVLLFMVIIPLSLFSQHEAPSIKAYFYPHLMDAQDILQDGQSGKKFKLTKNTSLIWVDLAPDLFFAHKTVYILVSPGKIRIKRGEWWPVLNGKTILYQENGQYAFISPFDIPIKAGNENPPARITMHVYPHALTAKDTLTDGSLEKMFLIDDNCLLVWVDLMPAAFFAHPTAYILISPKNIRVEHGSWWPTLNGKTILYGQKNKIGILSPFSVFY